MNGTQPGPYKVEPGHGVKKEIDDPSAKAMLAGKLAQFIQTLERAVENLQADPHGFGDPNTDQSTLMPFIATR